MSQNEIVRKPRILILSIYTLCDEQLPRAHVVIMLVHRRALPPKLDSNQDDDTQVSAETKCDIANQRNMAQ